MNEQEPEYEWIKIEVTKQIARELQAMVGEVPEWLGKESHSENSTSLRLKKQAEIKDQWYQIFRFLGAILLCLSPVCFIILAVLSESPIILIGGIIGWVLFLSIYMLIRGILE